jgi:tetratricopeptide (TPR) repeat protein
MTAPRTFVVAASIGVLLFGSSALANAGIGDCQNANCLADTAEGNSQYVAKDDLASFAENLARVGRFKAARAAADRIQMLQQSDSFNRARAEQTIALCEFAEASWAYPEKIAGYDALDAPAKTSGESLEAANASNYWLLAEQILNRSSWTGESPELGKLLRPKVLRRGPNASLDDPLNTRWPRAIEAEPTWKQGWHWDYVAQVWSEMGNRAAAAEAIERAEQSSAYDFQGVNRVFDSTARRWLELKNFDRALAAARQASSRSTRSVLEIDIARALLGAGKRDEAHETFNEALADAAAEPNTGRRMGLLLGIADGLCDVGDLENARRVADKMLDLAHQPDLFPAAQLAEAAAAYNDIGEHDQAAQILHGAVGKLPDPKKVIAVGVTLGPVTVATLGVGDSIRSSIAIELYRAGERDEFEKQVMVLSTEYQTRTWMELYAEAHRRGDRSPAAAEVLKMLPSDAQMTFENDQAVDALTSSDFQRAKGLLESVVTDFAKSQTPSSGRQLQFTAKVAFAAGFSDLTANAPREAAAASDKIGDRGKRAFDLASIAALFHELVDQPRVAQ